MVKLVVTFALWCIGLLAMLFILDRVGISERVMGFAATGAFFGLLAHIRTTENWKELRKKDLFSRSTWSDEAAVFRSAIRPSFESASERAWYVVLVSSLALMLLTYIAFRLGHRYSLFRAISRGSSSASPFDVIFYFGCAGAVVGALLSYGRNQIKAAYRSTLGRIVKWVQSGT